MAQRCSGRTNTWTGEEEILHAYEIMNKRRKQEIFDRITWTADFPMYTAEDGEAVLYLARKENNLIFKNIEEAEKQICSEGFYMPKQKDIESVVESTKSGATLRVNLSDLRLQVGGHLLISTYNYKRTLNRTERKLAEWVYGQGEDFDKNMEMLRTFKTQRIHETAIHLTYSETVKELAKDCAISFVTLLADNYSTAGFVCGETCGDVVKDHFLDEIKHVLGKNQGEKNAKLN